MATEACLNKWKDTKKVAPVHPTKLEIGQKIKYKNPLEAGEDKIVFKIQEINESTGRVHAITTGGVGGMRIIEVINFEDLLPI